MPPGRITVIPPASRLIHTPIWQALDAIVAAVFFCLVDIPLFLVFRGRPRPAPGTAYKLMTMPSGVSVDFLDQKRGRTLWELREHDVNGYFEKVLFVMFPMPKKSRRIACSSRVDAVEFHPFFGLFYYTTAAWMVFRLSILCVREKITHLRVTEGHYLGLIMYMISRATNIPFCLSVQTDFDKYDEMSGGKSKPRIFGSKALADRLFRFIIRRAYLVFTLSEYLKAYCLKKGAILERVRIVRHAIEDERVQIPPERLEHIRNKFQIPRVPAFLYVGRLHLEKGILDLVPIARHVRSLEPAAMCIVSGDGEDQGRLEEAIDRGGVRDAFKLLGSCSAEEVVALMRLCEVIFCPISGFVLIEAALACGAAVVGYDIEWQRELVDDGRSGFLFPEGKTMEAAEKIVQLFRDEPLRKTMAKRLREKAETVHLFPAAYAPRRAFYEELRTIAPPLCGAGF